MPGLKRIEKDVPVQQAGTNTRIEIPKQFVELFGIQKWDKRTETGDKCIWVFDPETKTLNASLKLRESKA